MTGYKDYFVLLRPDELVSIEINNCKGYARTIIGDYKSLHAAPHISVIKYLRQKPFIIEQSIDILCIQLRRLPAVTLQVNHFNYFIHKNDTYTIYAALQPTNQSDKWFTDLRKQLNIAKGQLFPHITVARTIDENSFLKLWPHFRYRQCRLNFHVNYITILERESHNTQARWKIYREISLMAKNEVAQQEFKTLQTNT